MALPGFEPATSRPPAPEADALPLELSGPVNQFQFAKLFCLLVTLSEAHLIAIVEARIYCAVCVTRKDLNKSAHSPESVIAVFCSEYY